MGPALTFTTIPDIILVLGTDAAGKDHIANLLVDMINEAGGVAEKRKRYITGKITRKETSVGKPAFELFLEKAFLALFPHFGFVLPWFLTHLLRFDLKRYRRSEKKLIIVGHNCIRGLAFWWGHKDARPEKIEISPALAEHLTQIRSIQGIHTLVLDIDDSLRKKRIERREQLGEADYFDRYLAKDSEKSEKIEASLVWLAQNYLDGHLIENNDLSENELRNIIAGGFQKISV